ncbi:MAG TPA: response regulator transcription factor [Anaerolineaceae bacterium]
MTIRILLAMPDEALQSGLNAVLTGAGYACTSIQKTPDLVASLAQTAFDLIILDTQIQQSSAAEVIRAVREAAPETGLVLLSEVGASAAVVQALRYRAQDVLTKPVPANRLLQRVRRVLMSRGQAAAEGEPPASQTGGAQAHELMSGGIDVNFERRLIQWDDQSVPLTATEARLLQVFFENPGRVLGHIDLVRMVQGYEVSAEQAAAIIRPLVSRLRRKLKSVPGGERWLQNLRGVGYIYEPAGHL